MLAQLHGQVWNSSEMARNLGVSDKTVREYLDFLVVRGRERLGFEFKRTRSPGLTPSMRAALLDLRLRRLLVVHSGPKRYPLGKRVEAVPLLDLAGAL